MNRGCIDKAPVFHDVITLRGHDLPKDIHLITAGFPCQDISSMYAKGEGIHGKRSKLFFEVVRLCKETKAKIVILENSPNIQHRGLDVVVDFLRRIGMSNIAWGVYSAEQVGAPHIRRRFFLVATRKNDEFTQFALSNLLRNIKTQLSKYAKTCPWNAVRPPVRIIPKTKNAKNASSLLDLQRRGFLLGNSIVPQCARLAVYELIQQLSSSHILRFPMSMQTCQILLKIPPEKRKPGGERTYSFRLWSTPLSTKWTTSRVGSSRSANHLPNQLMYDIQSLEYMKKKDTNGSINDWVVNPEFIEWMMGYPVGWARAAGKVSFLTYSSPQKTYSSEKT